MCEGISSSTINEIELHYSRTSHLTIKSIYYYLNLAIIVFVFFSEWSEKSFNLGLLCNLTSLTQLHVISKLVPINENNRNKLTICIDTLPNLHIIYAIDTNIFIDSKVTHLTGFTALNSTFPLREISFNNNWLSNWTEVIHKYS